MNVIKAPIIGINRHRILTDGNGVTTLVGFYGCPLRCKYCLNAHSISTCFNPLNITVDQLIDEVKCDDLYFKATGGGICFSGGEPLLYTEFIRKFREKCPDYWKIFIETSLNVAFENVESIEKIADGLIIDVKDMNRDIYRRYTGRDNGLVISNLKYLAANARHASICIRIPSIPDYNHYKDIVKTSDSLLSMGFEYNQFDRLTYIASRNDHHEIISALDFVDGRIEQHTVYYGKAVCEVLKGVREHVAKQHDLPIENSICTHKGNCKGTCPKCESELRSLACRVISELPVEKERLLEEIVSGLSEDLKQALMTNHEKPSPYNFTTDGLFPVPELYRITYGPLEGDLGPNESIFAKLMSNNPATDNEEPEEEL